MLQMVTELVSACYIRCMAYYNYGHSQNY